MTTADNYWNQQQTKKLQVQVLLSGKKVCLLSVNLHIKNERHCSFQWEHMPNSSCQIHCLISTISSCQAGLNKLIPQKYRTWAKTRGGGDYTKIWLSWACYFQWAQSMLTCMLGSGSCDSGRLLCIQWKEQCFQRCVSNQRREKKCKRQWCKSFKFICIV